MAKTSIIDRAYIRGQILSGILRIVRERAKAEPLNKRWVEIGILGEGETKEEALKTINDTFDELSEYIEFITILGMAASFEQASKARLSNHIGESKKRIKQTPRNDSLPIYREKLVQKVDDFQGLANLWKLLDGYVGLEMTENFAAIRDARNNIAHSFIERGVPKIDADTARRVLNELYERI